MPFTVGIDRQRCQGHGKCMIDCPEVFDTDEQGYATLTQPDFADELEELLRRAADDPGITSLVLTSGKPEGFIAGADVQMLQRVKTREEAAELARGGQQAMARLEELGKRKPIVAAIHGAALVRSEYALNP